MRSAEPVARLDFAYANDGIEPLPPAGSTAHISVARVEYGWGEPLKALQGLLVGLRSRGFAPGEVGVVSALGQAQSGILAAQSASAAPNRALRLSESWSMNQFACDSFSYWLGLERRVMVVVEAPTGLVERRRRLHIAVSRACDEVYFLLPKADVDADEVLSTWLRLASP